MAKATIEVIQLLRSTAEALRTSNHYQWGHMGSCNCGFLGQQVTRLSKAEIHRRAMQGHGDWNEQLNDYCPTSGLPFDDVVSSLLNAGFDIDDLRHLEKLGDPHIRSRIAKKDLQHNLKPDVLLYLNTWAQMLEEELLASIRLPEVQKVRQAIPLPA